MSKTKPERRFEESLGDLEQVVNPRLSADQLGKLLQSKGKKLPVND